MSPSPTDTQNAWTYQGPPLLSLVVNNPAPASDSGSGFLPTLSDETDKYLSEGAQPLFAIPLWVWLALGAAAVWWFWGRKHFDLNSLLGGETK